GMLAYLAISRFSYRKLWDISYILYGLALFFLFLVFLLGAVHLGAQRWLKIIWFNFQPSEFAKLITVIFLSRYFSKSSCDNFSLSCAHSGIFRALILPFLFVAIPMGMIIEQPDLGSALMLFAVFLIIFYLSGVKTRYIFILLATIMLSIPLFWHFLRDYQKERLMVFLNPNIDPLGAGYTIIQSKIAIGSGGLFGKGWLSGTQSQLHFLPEAHTDFIFATFAEEWGILGSSLLLLLYYLLIRRGFIIAQRSHDPFGRILALGISASLSVQVFVNIAMNFGIAPVVGLPLPLMSYGGSSVLVTFIALGVLVSIDRRTS
ncbi:MAG TPA: rod shape-determining protein RodA, partial [Candidatus Margulisiibacteriota bacterium]|nr:rod shape-determining protein RodA [Candidatus Margulisiibacteriota bacterium]